MRRGLAYWIWAFFAICLPLQKAGLFASDPDVKSLQCRHCMLPYRHQCHKTKIVAWYHDTNICGKAKQAACYDLPFWTLSARRTAEQQHDATSRFGFLLNLHELSPKFNRCKRGGGIKVLEENLVNVCRSQCAWSNHDGWQSIAILHSI